MQQCVYETKICDIYAWPAKTLHAQIHFISAMNSMLTRGSGVTDEQSQCQLKIFIITFIFQENKTKQN